jgi:hypothetical protein
MIAATRPTDFLSRVVMHAQGVAPVIRPRILSLYESQDASASAKGWDDPAESLFEPTARWQIPTPRTEVPRSERHTETPTSGSHAPPVLIEPVLPVQPAANLPDGRKPSSKHPVELDARPTGAESVTALRVSREQSSPQPQTVPAASPSPRRSNQALLDDDLAKQARTLPAQPNPIPTTFVPQMSRKPVVGSLQPSLIPSTAMNKAAAPSTVMPAPVAKATSPVLVMPAALPPSPRREVVPHSLPAPPPAITITIGRIEIRATAPSLPVPPTARATGAAPQSLDDYLKSRAGRS